MTISSKRTDFQCCFCGQAIVERGTDPVTLNIPLGGGGTQQLPCHAACLRRRCGMASGKFISASRSGLDRYEEETAAQGRREGRGTVTSIVTRSPSLSSLTRLEPTTFRR